MMFVTEECLLFVSLCSIASVQPPIPVGANQFDPSPLVYPDDQRPSESPVRIKHNETFIITCNDYCPLGI